MSFIEWCEEYETGIPGVDDEHKELIASINAFHEMLRKHPDKQDLLAELNDINNAIHSHFVHEERLMEIYRYDKFEEHKADHANLLNEIQEIIEKFRRDSECDMEQLTQRLNDWFLIHLRTHDARLHKLEALIVKDQNAGGVFSLIFGKIPDSFLRNK